MSLSIQTILGQVNRSAPRGDRIESNWNRGLREGARHERGWGTSANGRYPDAKALNWEKGDFPEKETGQCG